MKRIYTVYILRNVIKPLFFELLLLAGLVSMSTVYVSFSHVIANAWGVPGIQGLSTFIINAFIATKFIVKALCVLVLGVGLWFCYDTIRRVSRLVTSTV